MALSKFGFKHLTTLMLTLSLAACGGSGSGSNSGAIQEDTTSTIGVNGYLWLAALDTVSSFPIAQVDSSGGVILTDWFINPDAPTERLKLSVYILDRVLRADALNVSVVRQELLNGVWVNAPVREGTVLQVEDAILARAREIKIRTVDE